MIDPSSVITVNGYIVMKKHLFLLAFAAASLMPAATVLAADLDPPPPPVEQLRPASYDWTGGYVGGWIGATCIDGTLTDNGGPTDWEMSGCGYKGGLTAGYNHQMDSIVFGLEADWGMSGIIATNESPSADFSFSHNQIATARARLGFALDDTLIFATAGGAWAQGDLDGIISADPDHIKANHYGWTIGGGIEHAVTDSVRIKLDYLFTRFKGANYYSTSCTTTCDVDVNSYDDHEVRFGINYAF